MNALQRFNIRHGERPETVAWATGMLVALLGLWYAAGGVWAIIGLVAYLIGAAAAFVAGLAVIGILVGMGWLVARAVSWMRS